MRIEKLLPLLKCPGCNCEEISFQKGKLMCGQCRSQYPMVEGVAVMLKENKLSRHTTRQKEWFEKHYSLFSKEEYVLERWRLSMLRRIFAPVATKKISTYLDIGCGATGYTAIEAARQNGWLAIGIDISLEAMVRASNLAEKQGLANKTAFVVASAENLPFRDSGFDYVSAISLLEHLDDDKVVVGNIKRILGKNGYLYVCVPNTYKKMWPFLWPIYLYFDKKIGHKRHYSLKSLNNLLNDFSLKDYFYNAHLRKLWEIILEKLGCSSEEKWWKVEENDINKNPSGIQLNAVYQKREKI